MRFEFVLSLAAALVILSGAIVWTAASQPAARTTIGDETGNETARYRPGCRRYSQYEFKVGYLVSPNCLPQTN